MINAVIFDLDGVISDTQTFYSEVESGVLERYGIDISPAEMTETYSGVSYSQRLPELFGRFGVVADLAAVKQELHDAVDRHPAYNKIVPIGGALELINNLAGSGIKLAIASASRPSFIDHVLTKFSLKDKFGALVSGYDVAKGKPEPDIFLLAAERLGVAPEDCIVIEDGVSGMMGAKKAGMKCIGLVKQKDAGLYPADWLVTSLREVSVEGIRAL